MANLQRIFIGTLLCLSLAYLILWRYYFTGGSYISKQSFQAYIDRTSSISSKKPQKKAAVTNSIKMQKLHESIDVIPHDFRIITAFSSDYFGKALASCKSLQALEETQAWKPGYMIAYLLEKDMSSSQLIDYQRECPFVEIRDYTANQYYEISKDLKEYRWKPIIVEEVLQEVETIMWIDTSVIFRNNSNETLSEAVIKMNTKFKKCGLRQFTFTGHSIYSATNPSMLRHFGISDKMAKNHEMYEANNFIISKNNQNIIDKWKQCALKEECMAPKGSNLSCDYEKLYETHEYADCHRFDQSALSIITLQECSSNAIDFYEFSTLLYVERQ